MKLSVVREVRCRKRILEIGEEEMRRYRDLARASVKRKHSPVSQVLHASIRDTPGKLEGDRSGACKI